MPSLPGKQNPAFKHGLAPRNTKRSNAYRRWQHMIQRCHNPNDKDYPQYGGRGIVVCDRWRYDFMAFLYDMGTPPKGHTLDRIDVNGAYSKENCRWLTAKEQANNRRNTVYLTIHGVTLPLSAWCETHGICSKTVLYRLKQGWSHEDAIFKPSLRKNRSCK